MVGSELSQPLTVEMAAATARVGLDTRQTLTLDLMKGLHSSLAAQQFGIEVKYKSSWYLLFIQYSSFSTSARLRFEAFRQGT